jgi:hypothetical protein
MTGHPPNDESRNGLWRERATDMVEERLSDCRPPRRDQSVVSASSHPELLTGDLAMRPRIHVPLTAGEQALQVTWSRRTLGACGLIALVIIAISASSRHVIDDVALAAHAEKPTALLSCARWHETASEAVSQLTQTMRDADLRQVGDSIFRMRRALRNCEMGWLTLACQDYHAVVKSAPGYVNAQSASSFGCSASSQAQDARTTGSERMP